ncbi:PfkB family carbohydrate kinase [Saxibacter everestensis]|uniref:PfkB family carbohydrate kinase n=1 Tax=Saxibacter everestensis TaxID=2909229 RepID=A0ABY8QTW4_9MICO|nr:PfkB family carbohydrate kinase [Brevibacteriaceae bacterium ZFBP1038]
MTIHTLGLTPALDVVYVLDRIELGAIHRPDTVIRSAGGKSLNVARALAKFERPVRAIVPLGGHIGDLVESLLHATSVEVERIPSAVETRMCMTSVDRSSGALTEFYEPVTCFDVPLDVIAERLATIQPGEWLTVSGGMPAGIAVSDIADLLAHERMRGVRLAIDVHGPALPAILTVSRPDLIKINRAEAKEATGLDDADTAASALLEFGCGVAVITDGEAGSIAKRSGEVAAVAPAADPGLYPVGSGDCYLAGLVTALADGRDLGSAVAFASAAGAANARVPGAAELDLKSLGALHDAAAATTTIHAAP